jgi:TolB protein
MVMDADGSNQVKLAQHAVITSQSWSPDGEKVSYAVAAEDNKVELHVVDADGSNNRPVVFNREHDESHSWSQDGLWIAVASRDAGSPGIYTRNPLGVNQFRLTEAVDSAPIWSPKENELAFLSLEDGNLEIYVVNGEGNDRQRLTRNEARDYQASWSPDGKRLAFVSERDGNPEIYLVNVEDGEETRLTFNDFPAMQPVWRSNGKQIAFVSYHSGDGDIFVMDSDGEGQVRLTSNSSEDFMVSW